MKKSLALLLMVVSLDAIGLGLIMPVLPTLLRTLLPNGRIALHYGVLLSLYALMQVFFAPLLGHLSDRYGRRPVLLASLAGAALDYAIMAATPIFWVLYIGRLISGITGATGAVAASGIADSTRPDTRVRWFGFMGACYGGGMIAGPALGGPLAEASPHAPFIAAAILNGLGLLLIFLYFAETRHTCTPPPSLDNPARFVTHWRDTAWQGLIGLIGVFFILQLIGQAPAALWVIYSEDRFHWNTSMIGISLAAFGAMHALFQALIASPLSARLGERRALLLGMAADATGLILLAFASDGWMLFLILLPLAAGGVGMPSLQVMLSSATSGDAQGRLQGVLTSATHLSAIIGPIGFTTIYAFTADAWRGWTWIASATLYLACLPILYGTRARQCRLKTTAFRMKNNEIR